MHQYSKPLTQKHSAIVIALAAWACFVVVGFLSQAVTSSLTEAWSNASGVLESVVVMMLFACFITFSAVALLLAIYLSIRCFRVLKS